MKKAIFLAFLVLSIALSLIAGTLAMYTTTLDDLADGSVVAKEFIFMEDGTDTFAHQVKIAPTETIVWEFAVRNYDGAFITETDLYYHLIFDVTAFPGKQAIDPLIVTVKDENGVVLDTVTGTGTINIYDAFMLSEVGQRAGYSVEFYWPSNDEIDINYAGESFSTAINVSATASQLPFDISPEEPADPEDEEPDTPVLKPDFASLPAGADVYGDLLIENSSYFIENTSGFAAFTGSIQKTKPNAKLRIGRNNDLIITYLIYFEQGTRIYFNDGTEIMLEGFYLVTRGTDILEDALYNINGIERTLKDNSLFRICTDIENKAAEYGIPLTVEN